MSTNKECCVCGEKARFSVTNLFYEEDVTHYCEKHANLEPDFPIGTQSYKWKDHKKEAFIGWLEARKDWNQIVMPKNLVNDLIGILKTE